MYSKINRAKRNIKPFHGEKYAIWKFRIRALLTELDVLRVIDKDIPEKVEEQWKKAERCAKSTLIEYLSDSFLNFATSHITARQILGNFDGVYERKSLASQLAVRKRLLSLKLSSEMSLLSHFTIFDELISELLAAGAKIEEMDKVSHLLITLPSAYDGVITAIETLSEDNLTLSFVKNRLLDQEIKIKNDHNDTSRKALNTIVQNKKYNNKNNSFKNRVAKQKKTFKGNFKNRVRCHHCDKEGHIKKDCYQYKRILNERNKDNKNYDKQAKTATSQGIAFMVKEVQRSAWHCNLMSVKRLQEAGMSIKFDKNGVTISKSGLTVVENSGMFNNIHSSLTIYIQYI